MLGPQLPSVQVLLIGSTEAHCQWCLALIEQHTLIHIVYVLLLLAFTSIEFFHLWQLTSVESYVSQCGLELNDPNIFLYLLYTACVSDNAARSS